MLAQTVTVFTCSMCDKRFLTDSARIQHEGDKHRVGTLVEVFSAISTNDANSHSQPSGHDNQSNSDLIAFINGDEYDLLQLNLPTTTTEKDIPVEVSEDGNNTSEPSFELNDSGQLETSSPNNEKVTEITIAKRSEEDD